MSVARTAALGLRGELGLVGVASDSGLDRLAASRGLSVVRWPLPAGVREVVALGAIVIATWADRRWRRWLVAHAIGHDLLHAGNQVWWLEQAPVWVGHQERQADTFAGWLLFGEDWPRGVATWELAELGGVPAECVDRWLGLVELREIAGAGAAWGRADDAV